MRFSDEGSAQESMKRLIFSICAMLALLGCGADEPELESTADRPGDSTRPVESQAPGPGPETSQQDHDAFDAHLSTVEKGWSKQQLRDHAGEPDWEASETWYYQWGEDRIHGGHVIYFRFTFDERAISQIERSDGHVSRLPPQR